MTCEQFIPVFYERKRLRIKIRERARNRARNNLHDIEDYEGWAWAMIMEAPPGKTDDFYFDIAFRAIESARWNNYKNWRAAREAVNRDGCSEIE